MYRDLLVHVDGHEMGRRRVQFAADLASRTGARLAGLHVTPPVDVPPLYKPSLIREAAAELTARLDFDAAAAGAIFAEETRRDSGKAIWSAVAGSVAEGINNAARYADLVILGQYGYSGSFQSHPLPVAHSVALQCGRPVLVVPEAARPSAFARIVVAWDGSREAIRAVHDALPLLRLSQAVQILKMLNPADLHDHEDAQRIIAHLHVHGISVRPDVLQIRTLDEPAALQEHIEQERYDLLVMGAYSHPKWFEFIFGGLTQSTLLSSKIPVLVSH